MIHLPACPQETLTISHQYVPVQVTAYGTGVLIFMENNQTSEFIMLHFIERKLVFDFNNGEELLRIYSRANICSGCWFKVIATRSVQSAYRYYFFYYLDNSERL